MDERSRVFAATLAGAAIGGVIGYLFFTADGRRVREQIEPWLDEAADEIRRFRASVRKARAIAGESRRALNDVFGEPRETMPR